MYAAKVSQAEWEAIPETGDHSLKYKQQQQNERYMPVPDDVIEMKKGSRQTNTIDPNQPGAASSTGNLTDVSVSNNLYTCTYAQLFMIVLLANRRDFPKLADKCCRCDSIK